MKSDNHIINYMTSHFIELTQWEQLQIITYPEIDFSLIICYLIYLTFSVNLYNQLFKSTFAINLLNQFILN